MITSKIKIFLLFLKTINCYGIVNSGKIFFFELIGLIFLRDLESLSYDDDETSSYLETKKTGEYNVPYIPTPYYFLYLIKKNLLASNIKKINFIDIGCGYCRPAKYLSKKFDLNFSGIELSKDITKKVMDEKNINFKIYNFNLRDKKKTKSFFKNNLKKNINNVIIISDTVEINQINKIFKSLDNHTKIILIFINVKYKKFKNKKFKIKKKILFKQNSRNIIFLDNYN
mgnify:CR=1 FL=1